MAIDPAVQTEVRRLLTVAEKESLLRGMEDLYSYLKNNGLLYSLQVNSKLVGCHHANRDGYGVDPVHCHALVDTFHEVGFVPAANRYIAVEVPVGPKGEEIRRFNQELVNSSNNLSFALHSVRFPFFVWTGMAGHVKHNCHDAPMRFATCP